MNLFTNLAFSLAKKQSIRFLKKNGRLNFYEKSLNSITNPNLKTSLERYGYTKEFGNCNFSLTLVEDIIEKLKMCKDEKIKTKAIEMITNAGNKSNKELSEAIHNADNLLDSENVIEGMYSPLFSQCKDFIKGHLYTKHSAKEYTKALNEGNLENAEYYIHGLIHAYSEARSFFTAKKLKYMEKNISDWNSAKLSINEKINSGIKDLWQENSLFGSLREYIQFRPEDKETAKYLWETKYLPYIKQQRTKGNKDETEQIIKLMKDIDAKFGTKIFIDEKESEITCEALEFIKKEFDMWKQAGQGKEKFPVLLNITDFNQLFTKTALGCCNYEQTAIYLRKYFMTELRHEMAHLNINRKQPPPDEVTCWLEDEYRRAGLSKEIINYAKTAYREEPFAVYAQGNMQLYSEKMHQHMGNKFIKNLAYHNFYREQLKYEGLQFPEEFKDKKYITDADFMKHFADYFRNKFSNT